MMQFDRDPADRKLNALHLMILKLAGRPEGVTNPELRTAAGISTDKAASALHCAARWERILSCEHPGDKDHRRRYFVSREHSESWMAGPVPPRVQYPKRKALSDIGVPVKSLAKLPGPQLLRDRAPQGHTWRPPPQTTGASKMAAKKPCVALQPTAVGASPPLGAGYRYWVDPAAVQGPLMDEWRKLRGQA